MTAKLEEKNVNVEVEEKEKHDFPNTSNEVPRYIHYEDPYIKQKLYDRKVKPLPKIPIYLLNSSLRP